MEMNTDPSQGGVFQESLFEIGAAFDQACFSLQHLGADGKVREILAKRIFEAD